MLNLQKASFGKRIIAAIFDFMFIAIIAIGFLASFVSIFKVDNYSKPYIEKTESYKIEYNLNITAEDFESYTDQEKADYAKRVAQAEEAFAQNEKEVMASYGIWIRLILIGSTLSILLSVFIVEFVCPLFLGNGQTLGKKIFGIALMHRDHICVSNVQLFVRAVLGKFTIEIMIPLYIIAMAISGRIGISGPIILLVLLVIELICMAKTRTNSLLHDIMSNIVAVDMASQKIFDTRKDLENYIKKIHAEKAKEKTF